MSRNPLNLKIKNHRKKIKVAITGYGVIGRRVADAIQLQNNMGLAGVCDVISEWHIRMSAGKNYPVYEFDEAAAGKNKIGNRLKTEMIMDGYK